jgi:hypothetical protein
VFPVERGNHTPTGGSICDSRRAGTEEVLIEMYSRADFASHTYKELTETYIAARIKVVLVT